MIKRLFVVWVNYRLHHIMLEVVKYTAGFVIFAIPVAATPVVTHHFPGHHKKPIIQNTSASKPLTTSQFIPTKKTVAKANPSPVTATPTPAVQTPLIAKPTPIPATEPSPGSGAKKLVAVPPSQNPSPPASDSSSPAGSGSGSSSSPVSNPTPPTPTYATGGYSSTNWSGYLATTAIYKHIAGSWVVPNATGNGTATTADSTWIGIGGVFSNDLIQTGTFNTVSVTGHLESTAFYELLPDTALAIPSLEVSAGDSMSAAIDETATGTWTISLTDNSTKANFTTTVTYRSSYSSAEWIEEDPSFSAGGLISFDNFSQVNFTAGQLTINSLSKTISAANASPITLVDQTNHPVARPTILSTEGSSFQVIKQ